MSKIEFKNHNEEFDRSYPLCDVIKVDGQLYVHISKVKVFQDQLQQKENIIKEVREYITSKKFEENFPYVANECQVRSAIIKILDKKEVN